MIKKKEGLLLAGLFCIISAIIFTYSFDETRVTDFFQVLFMGLSVAFIILYLIKIRLSRVI